MELKGSKTEANLMAAFAGESQARNCGAIVESESAPDKCPVCDHPKSYFQLEQNNF